MQLVSFGKTQGNSTAGIGNKSYFHELPDGITLAKVPASPTTPEEAVTINGDHTIDDPQNDGWSMGVHKNRKGTLTGSDEADVDTNAAKVEHTIFCPDHPRIAGICQMKAEKAFVVLVSMKDCDAPKKQLGTECNPAIIEKWTYGAGNYDGSEINGYYITFSVVQKGMIYYDGDVTPVLAESTT